MRLNKIKDNEGAMKKRVRVGRGIGSGVGKTAGRGVKGQKSRSGVAINGYEGGQMPIYRRLPKRGFTSINRKDWNEVSLGRLQAAVDAGKLDAGKPVDVAALVEAGVCKRARDGVRIIGGGEIKAGLKITANHVTAGAKSALESAGGSIEIIELKVLQADVDKREKSAAKKKAKAEGKK